MAGAGTIEDVFSICFGGVEGNGALMIGDVLPATFNLSLQYTPLILIPAHLHYYVAHLENVAVNGSILPVDKVRSIAVHCGLLTAVITDINSTTG